MESDKYLTETIKPRILEKVRDFPDFPKPGILFRDIMPIFEDPVLVNDLCKAIGEHIKSTEANVSVVTALEARGFLFGPQIAGSLGVPFVPIRKKGKLPGEVLRTTYVKEYGEDIVEIQKDALKAGSNVIIFDDLIATGGTLKAAIDLVQKTGAKVSEVFCIVELEALNGRKILPNDIPIFTLIKF